jgi:hypothetical protein
MGAMLVNYQGYYCTIFWVWNCRNMDDAIPTTSVRNLPFILKFCSKCVWINARSYIGVRGGRVGVCSGRSLAKIVEQRAIKIGSNIFIVGKFCKKCTCKIGDFKIIKHFYM